MTLTINVQVWLMQANVGRFFIYVMGQRWALIETESETSISQMYGYNAGRPASSLYTKYYRT